MKTITLRLEDELHKRLKMYSVEEEKTMQDIIIEMIEQLLKESEK